MKKHLTITSLILFAVFGIIIIKNQSLFIFYGDNYEQLIPFYNHLVTLLKNGTFSFWDPSVGFGSNIFIFFFNAPLGSPFLYLTALFQVEFIPYYFLFTLIIRFLFTSVFSYLWISKLSRNETTRIVASLIFTFSGWAMYWLHYNTSLDFYMYIPLMLYLSEEVLESKKFFTFILVIFLAAISSLYYFYIFTWLIFIYHTLRYLLKSDKPNIRNYFNDFFKLVVPYMIGIGLSAFIVLPNISIILSSPRISEINGSVFLPDISVIKFYSFLTSFMSPVLSDYDTNIYISRTLFNEVLLNYQYSFLLFPFTMILLIFVKNKKKWYLIATLGLLYISSFIPIFSYIFNGNADKRWFLIIVIVQILSLIYVLDQELSKKYLRISTFIIILIFVTFTLISIWRNLANSNSLLISHLLLSILVFIIYNLYFSNRNKYVYLIFIAIMLESVYSLNSRIYVNDTPRYILAERFDLDYFYEGKVYDEIMSLDNGYYRIDEYNSHSNNPINYSYPGVSFYSSVYNHETRSLLDERFSSGWNSGYVNSKLLLKSLLNTKYFVSESDNYVPYGFKKIETIDTKSIYQNKFSVGLGFATSKTINYDLFNAQSKSLQDVYMYQGIVTKNESTVNDYILPLELSNDLVNDYVEFPDEAGYIMIDYSNSNPYTDCKIDFYKNRNLMYQEVHSEYGYLMIKKPSDIDAAYVYCSFLYNPNESIAVDISYYKETFIDDLYTNVSSFDLFTNINFEMDSVTADINVSNKNSIAFINIPYDKGWTLEVDGIKVPIMKVNDGFIGFSINEGNHKIKLTYLPPMFKIGIFTSIISLIIIILIKIKLLKNKL